jgi:hypothetical protein
VPLRLATGPQHARDMGYQWQSLRSPRDSDCLETWVRSRGGAPSGALHAPSESKDPLRPGAWLARPLRLELALELGTPTRRKHSLSLSLSLRRADARGTIPRALALVVAAR